MLHSFNDSSLRWYPRIVVGLCGVAIFIACLAMVGWQFNITALKSISESYEPLYILTAIFIIITSLSIILIRHSEVNRKEYYLSKMLAVCTLVGNTLTLLYPSTPQTTFWTVSFLSSINLILVSLCIIFIDNAFFNKKIFSIIISIVFLNSLLSLLEYIFIKNPDYKIVTLTRMSIYTSLEFFMLCIAVLLTRPTRGLVPIFLDKTIDAAFLRRVPSILIKLPCLSFCWNRRS